MTHLPAAATTDLVQAAFAQLACPLDGHSLYATLEDVVRKAYELGAQKAAARPVVLYRTVPVSAQAEMEAA